MRIIGLGNTATDFASDDYIAIDGTTNGSRKMNNDSLLKVTAQNALADNVAPKFVPNETEVKEGRLYVYGGKLYKAKESYQGLWDVNKFTPIAISDMSALLHSDLDSITTPSSINLFNKDSVVDGSLSATGEIESSDTIFTSDYIDVGGNPFAISFGTIPSDSYIRIGYYNDDKTFVVREVAEIHSPATSVARSNSSHYKYVRISIVKTADNIQLELGVNSSSYVPYRITAIDSFAQSGVSKNKNRINAITTPFPPNLFDKDAVIDGVINSDGAIVPNSTIIVSDFIDVDKKPFTVSFGTIPSDGYVRVGFYDDSKTFATRTLSSISSPATSVTYSNSSEYKYVRLSVQKSAVNIQLELGTDASDYSPFKPSAADCVAREGVEECKNDIESNYQILAPNLFNANTAANSLLNADGSLTPNSGYIVSGFIDVDKKPFTVSFGTIPVDTYVRIGFYDDSKEFVNREFPRIYSPSTSKTNSNIGAYKYVRICVDTSASNMQVQKGTTPSDYTPYALARHGLREYDVCIIGGGAAGVSAAYALKNSGLRVCLVESQPYLGGTHTQGFVSSMVPTPSPSFLKDVYLDLVSNDVACISHGEHSPMSKADALAIDWKTTFKGDIHLVFNNMAMSMKYFADLSSDIDIILGHKVVSCRKTLTHILSVELDDGRTIAAKQFIDCSATNAILKVEDGEMVYGGDSATRYQADYGFTEEHGYTENYDFCNAATLMYRATKGTEDLHNIEEYYHNRVAYYYYQTDPTKIYCNSMNYIDPDSGMGVIENGVDAVYNALATQTIRQWKKVKNGFLVGKLPNPTSDYKFDKNAPMLGIRESYRALCERMLHEANLYDRLYLVTIDRIKDGVNLDKAIGLGTYVFDLFGDPHVTAEELTEMSHHVFNYMVPYGSIVPKNYKNLLVASKAAGMTHLAQSSFRLTKNMMQLGWAAGNATRLLFENELDDYRDVDVETLQSDGYAGIYSMIYDYLVQ